MIPMLKTTSTHTLILGGGVIGLALARELATRHAQVTVVDPQAPAGEATHAAAGMLAPDSERHPDKHFRALQTASRDLYPDYVAALEKETGKRVGFRTEGTIVVGSRHLGPKASVSDALREPELVWQPALFYPRDFSIDNRLLAAALIDSCRRRGGGFVGGWAAQGEHGGVILEAGGALEGATIVNAAGCWAGKIAARGIHLDVRPVKGQIAAIRAEGWKLRHSVRDEHVYLVPRGDGRVIVGATMEEAGYDKSVDPLVIRRMLEAGARLVPKTRNAPLVESWAGLRPATRTGLPLIGPAKIPGYFIATGHLRDGILLAPITAKLLAETIRTGKTPDLLKPYAP